MTDIRTTTPAPAAPAGHRWRRSVRRRVLVVLAVLVLLGLAICVGGFYALQARYDANIDRIEDPFLPIPEEERPPLRAPAAQAGVAGEAGEAGEAPPAGEIAQTYLLVGSDSRISAGDPAQWKAGAQRTDAIMLAHIPADRSGAFVVSIPRDTWVSIPGRGKGKVNAAFSYGGPTLLIRTIEALTSVRIDHLLVVDFEGFVAMTDALGGVDVTVARATRDSVSTFRAGTQHMDGETALGYVRQRHGLPGGDFDRVKRQQNWIRAVMGAALDRGTLTNPLELASFLDATTKSLAADEGFDIGEMRGLAFSLRSVRGGDVVFLTVPTDGTGRSADGQSIVLLDEEGAEGLFAAMATDTVGQWVAATSDADVLGGPVR